MASATLPWIPPAVVRPLMYIYVVFPEDTDVFLVCRADGRIAVGFGYIQQGGFCTQGAQGQLNV